MYGGVKQGGAVCSELWAFDVSAKAWENITVKTEPCLANTTAFCGKYTKYKTNSVLCLLI